ncbi:hypothetical protein SAMN04488058_102189 [Deinococcus reticulitermitis]|uniref:HIT domain-containing protein n=1 Tax=Deinococcus reticulitermitis TaxID=856736 RepID=A0A1H6UM06_9DEIO|nr:hypothetical protein [Deinococcus reticulitermitis]SEI90747.1 hypothetical protein SAMN04488058_102189 [Deinococcus reticulitermitis]
MRVTVNLDGTLLAKREAEWAHGLARPQKHPLSVEHRSPHVHLHVIPRWTTDAAAGAGVRYFLRAAAHAVRCAPDLSEDPS